MGGEHGGSDILEAGGVSSVGEDINQGGIVVDVNIVVGRCQALNLR